jgi:hypothetical protein
MPPHLQPLPARRGTETPPYNYGGGERQGIGLRPRRRDQAVPEDVPSLPPYIGTAKANGEESACGRMAGHGHP